MASETMQRLFDPFFTTKQKGRGLGLAEVMGIMRAHQGAIFVSSLAGKGTSVRLAWPCLPTAPQTSDTAAEAPPEAHAPSQSEGNTILVVDDEPSVLAVTQRFLSMSGFAVLTATDGQEGVSAFRKSASTIDLVLLDLTMPKLDGVQAFREIRQLRPDVPVIIASGYNEHETLQRFGTDQPSGFLQKPYMRDTLLGHVSTWVKGAGH
jgi:CheY-like chemotaxis protein